MRDGRYNVFVPENAMKSVETREMFSSRIATKLTCYMLPCSRELSVAFLERSGTVLMRDIDVMFSGPAA